MIFNHTNERGFYRFENTNLDSLEFIIDLFLSIICKSAVPLFFMISGAMLLSKEESILATYKRIPKILVDLILFQILYYWTDSVLSGSTFTIKDILYTILNKNYWHLWYLYAYIALLITLPFMRKFVNGLDVKNSIYMLSVGFLTMGIIPIIEQMLGQEINPNLKPSWLITNIFIYPVAGYVVDRVIDIKKVQSKNIVHIWVLNIICLIIGEISEHYFLIKNHDYYNETFLTNFCLMNSITVFLTIKYILIDKSYSAFACRMITEIGKSTFGIYLFHIWFLWKIPLFYSIWMNIENNSIFNPMVGVLISCIGTFIIAGLLVYCLRNIPIVKKLF